MSDIDIKSINKAIAVMEQDAKTIENLRFHNKGLQTELRQVNEYKDKLTAAVHVLLDTLKRNDDPTAAMYQLEELL